MTNHQDHIKDIQDIKSMMEKSSKFLSLSGLSGVSAGIIALIGTVIAYYILDYGDIKYTESFYILPPHQTADTLRSLFVLGLIVLVAALGSGFYFSWLKFKKQNLPINRHLTRSLLNSLLIPLVTGGILCIIMFLRHDISWVASVTLIFYGLGLVSAAKYTLSEVQYLGISEIILGLLAAIFINYGLLFWALGFGVLHIVYGIIAYVRYDKKA